MKKPHGGVRVRTVVREFGLSDKALDRLVVDLHGHQRGHVSYYQNEVMERSVSQIRKRYTSLKMFRQIDGVGPTMSQELYDAFYGRTLLPEKDGIWENFGWDGDGPVAGEGVSMGTLRTYQDEMHVLAKENKALQKKLRAQLDRGDGLVKELMQAKKALGKKTHEVKVLKAQNKVLSLKASEVSQRVRLRIVRNDQRRLLKEVRA